MSNVLRKVLTGAVAGLAAAAVAGSSAPAWADPAPEPPPPPPPPNVNALTPDSPVDFAVADGVYAFTGPGAAVTCLLNRAARSYGCNGPLPGAPNGANVVTGGPTGEPGFGSADRPLYPFDKPVQQLAEGTRLSTGTISCGVTGGSIVCSNSFDQTGFVIAPGGSYTFGAVNPMLDRPEGTNPYIN